MAGAAADPQGPLALADLIGPDTVKAVAESLDDELKKPLYAPPPLPARTLEAGQLGRKTSRHLHTYVRLPHLRLNRGRT